MPVVTSGKVLVTGANGFVAPHVILLLLKQGYSIRAAVRAEAKGAPLKKRFAEYGDKFELVVVADVTKEGAFDDAVRGVTAIMHLLTPNRFDQNDLDAFIPPAIQSIRGLLTSAFKYGSSVRRFIFTSTIGAVANQVTILGLTDTSNPRVYTEDDWNDKALQEVEEKGNGANTFDMYGASKVHAERVAWAFVAEHKSKLSFDLVAINPPWVFGPNVIVDKPEDLGVSMRTWWDVVREGKLDMLRGGEYIDVRDLADAHVAALQKEAAAGHRILVSGGPFQFQNFIDAAHAVDKRIPAGDSSLANEKNAYRYDTSKSVKLLDIKYRSLEETTKDIISQYNQLGWIA